MDAYVKKEEKIVRANDAQAPSKIVSRMPIVP